ncbi:hypothetical protein CDD80_6038 [Ophiocordyceps camponoti-rufipedis]|uniref:Uncharacterized protein n=1 Tax=Ophiocordyceps camponoti-rufipedis TaxID=2004952 RepID=A0A2C5ZGK4_9HYPO|nr:hypothetical protein CDD80_6038 [Ophiocordyceps camponoti-rufipedis]
MEEEEKNDVDDDDEDDGDEGGNPVSAVGQRHGINKEIPTPPVGGVHSMVTSMACRACRSSRWTDGQIVGGLWRIHPLLNSGESG